MSATNLPTREGYDQWSAVYDTDGNPLIALEEPRVAELMGPVNGLEVVDIGCGTGRHSLRLAAMGARVTGVDFSPGMLSRARAKTGGQKVKWVEHDLAKRLPLAGGAFDRVLCALVLDHIADCRGLFAEFARLVKPVDAGGRIVVSCMHPAIMLRGVQARFTDPATGAKMHVQSVPNQISDYVMAATDAGLRMTHMSEHFVDESLVARSARAEQHLGWPLLLMMGLVRAK